MILEEAIVGGTVYLDYLESEMQKPEPERVAFVYRALTNREKATLLHSTPVDRAGMPNGVDICERAITAIRNVSKPDGALLDTVAKMLAFNDKDNTIAYMLELAGREIWRRQMGNEVELKN